MWFMITDEFMMLQQLSFMSAVMSTKHKHFQALENNNKNLRKTKTIRDQ